MVFETDAAFRMQNVAKQRFHCSRLCYIYFDLGFFSASSTRSSSFLSPLDMVRYRKQKIPTRDSDTVQAL